MMVQRGGVSQISCTQQKEAANSQDMSILELRILCSYLRVSPPPIVSAKPLCGL